MEEHELFEMEIIFLKLINQKLQVVINDVDGEHYYYDMFNEKVYDVYLKRKQIYFNYWRFRRYFDSYNKENVNDFLNHMIIKHLNYVGFSNRLKSLSQLYIKNGGQYKLIIET